jgi:hypothetical protein
MLRTAPSPVGRVAGVTQPHPGLLAGGMPVAPAAAEPAASASTETGTDTSPPVAVPVHCPPAQTCPVRHAVPHAPQLRMSVFKSTQAPPHSVSPLAQAPVHTPTELTAVGGIRREVDTHTTAEREPR